MLYNRAIGPTAAYLSLFPGDSETMQGGIYIVRQLAFCALVLAASIAAADEQVGYNQQIRPLLSDRCFQCHGPDAAERAAGLRLDERESATGESDSGYQAIVPGDLEASELVFRISSDDPDLVMPPPESGKSLNSDEIELLKQWIKEGAEYEPHWAFIAPTRPEPPSVKQSEWPEGPIDRFVLARLEEKELAPSPQADRVTLLRRLTFDLTGLPPSREEVRAFLNDTSPDAYERAVDRLLASPRYGEHMARYWLDAVRYGDTHGLHLDNYREMWPYRDWVVRAFNNNLPWDKFTVMQVAGDLLPNATLDDKIASGFNRCHVSTNEGGSIAEEVYVRNVVDRVSTTGTVFLGLTMGCAVCHDHKFDPISAKDFYSSFAFFNSMDGEEMDGNSPAPAPVISAPTPEQQAKLNQLSEKVAELEAKLTGPWPEVDELQSAWEAGLISEHASGDEPRITVGTWHSVGPFREIRRYLHNRKHGPEGKSINLHSKFEVSTGDEIGWQAQPHWADGQVIEEFSEKIAATFIYRRIDSDRRRKLKISLGTDDGVKIYLNRKLVHHERVERPVRPDDIQIDLPLKKGRNDLLLKIINYGGKSGFYFDIPTSQETTPAEVVAAVHVEADKRSEEQAALLQQHFRLHACEHEELDDTLAQVAEAKEQLRKLKDSIPTTLVMKERAEPRPAYLLKRGQYDAPDKQLGPLQREVPSFLPPLPDGAPRNRLGYAQWLVAPEQPLMARVTVNRLWQQCFGTGIVETADDFGSQGSWPSHPALLDWLAVEFRESGWDVKAMMKKMVMSRTYRQSSKVTKELLAADPQNRLLSRGPRFRLDAEMLRDQALQVSGLLVNELGGPGVKPPQPDGLWKAVAYSASNTNKFVADTGPEKVHRRSIYTFWKRTSPPPQMTTLDAPSRESCVVRRERTNTPLAALLLLNDPQFVEAARKLAERSVLDGGGSASEIAESMFTFATLRKPGESEVSKLVETYEESLARYKSDPQAAAKLLAVGESPVSEEIDQLELAAWTLVANAVLNFDEVLNKE